MVVAGIVRAALVGNSFGGAVALRVAAVAPERVWALALISAPPPDLEPSPELRRAWEAEESALEDGDLDAAAAAVAEAWVQLGAPAGVRARVAVMQRRAFELQADAEELPEAADPAGDIAALKRIDVPVLVAAGEHDMVDFRDGAGRMADALPDASRVLIEGARHLAPLEAPQLFRELVLDFLRRPREKMDYA
jgi:pimeloyl-ACP methyl ester carboxylesterase